MTATHTVSSAAYSLQVSTVAISNTLIKNAVGRSGWCDAALSPKTIVPTSILPQSYNINDTPLVITFADFTITDPTCTDVSWEYTIKDQGSNSVPPFLSMTNSGSNDITITSSDNFYAGTYMI